MKKNVAILGASENSDRFSYKAFKALQKHQHNVFLVNPHLESIEQNKVFKTLNELKDSNIDTLTVYVNPQRLKEYLKDILELKPKRVIFNPGTESLEVEKELATAGILTMNACTLVLLNGNQF